jgi:hypothetical protein
MIRDLWQTRRAWRKAPPALAIPVDPRGRQAA